MRKLAIEILNNYSLKTKNNLMSHNCECSDYVQMSAKTGIVTINSANSNLNCVMGFDENRKTKLITDKFETICASLE